MQNAKFFNQDPKSTKRVRNSLNYDPAIQRYERNTQPSKTIPDQSLTVREILDRYARGLPLEGVKVPIYDEEQNLPDIRTLDLAERQELKEQYQEQLERYKQQQKDFQEAKLKEEQEQKDQQKSKDDTVDKQEQKPDPTTKPPAPKS